jgi:hypothetical protein
MDFIYDNLSGGNWIDAEGYGYGWQPDVVVRIQTGVHSDGYWVQLRWLDQLRVSAGPHITTGAGPNLTDYGWVWFREDLDWGPAWVSWRTGAITSAGRLPPRGPGVVYEGQPIAGTWM